MARGAVVVTGASSGIGAACARVLAAQGFAVFATVRNPADGERLRADIPAGLMPLVLDVTDAATIHAAAATVTETVGARGLAGLVNNAGVVVGGPLEYLPLDALRYQLEVNVVGQVAVTQAFVPLLHRARGRIVNIGSISDRVAWPLLGAYSASKFALAALNDTLRLELRPWGIRVILIEPGQIATPIWHKSLTAAEALAEQMPPEVLTRYATLVAYQRENAQSTPGVAPEKVARVVFQALTARRPHTHYLVGANARLAALVARLPAAWRDALFARRLRWG